MRGFFRKVSDKIESENYSKLYRKAVIEFGGIEYSTRDFRKKIEEKIQEISNREKKKRKDRVIRFIILFLEFIFLFM